MKTFKTGCAIAALATALPMASVSTSQALPAAAGLAAAGSAQVAPYNADAVTQVQFRRGGFRGGFRGGGFRGGRGIGLGIGAGLLLGGAAAAAANPYYGSGYYGPGYGYGYGPRYYNNAYGYDQGYDEGYEVAPVDNGGGDSVAYCQSRFKSYNPNTGTYKGYDGNTYSCP